MENKKFPQIIVITGRSGSGKSTLAKMLELKMNCEKLGFSYAGRYLASEAKDSKRFIEINNYICGCIISAVQRGGQVIVDGLASSQIAEKLRKDGYTMLVLFLNTPYEVRIERIAKRQNCSILKATIIEQDKAKGKDKAGIETIIGMADFELNGKQEISAITAQAEIYINEFINREIGVDGGITNNE